MARKKRSAYEAEALLTRDAFEAGQHIKHGGWRTGLLIARNVDKGRLAPEDRTAAQRAVVLANMEPGDVPPSLVEWVRPAGGRGRPPKTPSGAPAAFTYKTIGEIIGRELGREPVLATTVQVWVSAINPTGVTRVTPVGFIHPDKVSAKEFARRAGVSTSLVTRYLDGWDSAAAAGVVPPAASLSPGDDLDLPTDDGNRSWNSYFEGGVARTLDQERKAAVEAEAQRQNVGPSKAKDIASNPKAMSAAIVADDKTAREAERALQVRRERRAAEAARELPELPPVKPDPFQRMVGVNDAIMRLDGAVNWLRNEARGWDSEQREYAGSRLQEVADRLGMVIAMVVGVDDAAVEAAMAEWGDQQ